MNQSTSTPFHHNSTVPPWHWQDGPNTRGTWNIISSCVITLCLCLWTALHLNIPEHHGTISQGWRKVWWLFIGLLAPEMVVFTALEQRRAALAFTREMRAHFGEEQASKSPKLLSWLRPKKDLPLSSNAAPSERESNISDRRHRWTPVHSFYALMGGFAFDTSCAPAKFLPNETTRLTIRLNGLRYIAEHAPALIPDISEEDLRDKSKANGLVKILVCLQAIWFCVQCIVRVAQSQEISFLEINTSAHAICALLTYALWWHKPLDIESPSILTGKLAWEMCALMYVTSNGENSWNFYISRYMFRRNFSLYTENLLETELSRGQKYEDRVIARWTDLFNGRHLARLKEHQSQPRAILRWDPAPISADGNPGLALEISNIRNHSQTVKAVQVRKGDSLFGFRCMDVYTQADWCRAFPVWKNFFQPPSGKNDHRHRPLERTSAGAYKEQKYQRRVIACQAQRRGSTSTECTFEPVDLNRWALVSCAWQRYRPTPQQHDLFAKRASAPRLYNGIGRRIGNWPRTSLAFLDGSVTFDIRLLTFSIAAGLYGGLHLLAWDALFGSDAEQLLWRASCLLLVMSGCIIILGIPMGLSFNLLRFISSLTDESSSKLAAGLFSLLGFGWDFLLMPLRINMGICALAYIPARAFLIAESCIQLARLPPGAYYTPQWSKYYPHIS
ncbi:hypothetical protein MMC22_008448 [Lobaria immixta]|nr:hypothetical protein [Lobaria immixta]